MWSLRPCKLSPSSRSNECAVASASSGMTLMRRRVSGFMVVSHIIFSKHATTGDGILTSLMVMEVLIDKKLPLSTLTAEVVIYPQLLKNVRVANKAAAKANPAVQKAVEDVAEALGDDGRILVRESGTEPVIRVMVEAPDDATCAKYVDQVVSVMHKEGLVTE